MEKIKFVFILAVITFSLFSVNHVNATTSHYVTGTLKSNYCTNPDGTKNQPSLISGAQISINDKTDTSKGPWTGTSSSTGTFSILVPDSTDALTINITKDHFESHNQSIPSVNGANDPLNILTLHLKDYTSPAFTGSSHNQNMGYDYNTGQVGNYLDCYQWQQANSFILATGDSHNDVNGLFSDTSRMSGLTTVHELQYSYDSAGTSQALLAIDYKGFTNTKNVINYNPNNVLSSPEALSIKDVSLSASLPGSHNNQDEVKILGAVSSNLQKDFTFSPSTVTNVIPDSNFQSDTWYNNWVFTPSSTFPRLYDSQYTNLNPLIKISNSGSGSTGMIIHTPYKFTTPTEYVTAYYEGNTSDYTHYDIGMKLHLTLANGQTYTVFPNALKMNSQTITERNYTVDSYALCSCSSKITQVQAEMVNDYNSGAVTGSTAYITNLFVGAGLSPFFNNPDNSNKQTNNYALWEEQNAAIEAFNSKVERVAGAVDGIVLASSVVMPFLEIECPPLEAALGLGLGIAPFIVRSTEKSPLNWDAYYNYNNNPKTFTATVQPSTTSPYSVSLIDVTFLVQVNLHGSYSARDISFNINSDYQATNHQASLGQSMKLSFLGGDSEYGLTNNFPSVSIKTPTPNTIVNSDFQFYASASESAGIHDIAFYDGNTLLYDSLITPYSFTVDVSKWAQGTHTLKVIATSNNGLTSEATDVISYYTSPTITSPANLAILSGPFTFSAAGGSNIVSVNFYINGALIGTDSSSPFAISVNPASYSQGTKTLMVREYDASGNYWSASITVSFSTYTGGGSGCNPFC